VSEAVSNPNIARHVAIIMDGNGRWAQRLGKARNQGHREGVKNVERIVDAARQAQIPYLTLYAFSVENWNRPKLEVEALMRLLESFLKKQRKQLIEKEIRLRAIGRIAELPSRVRNVLEDTIAATAHFDQWNLSLCLNYGSRTEVIDAVQAYAKATINGDENPDKLDWTTFNHYLYTTELPDPDLIIRTSGETRISNFLLLQSAYAEYYFSEKCWPEFSDDDFFAALNHFASRERRFGLTGEQIRTTHTTES